MSRQPDQTSDTLGIRVWHFRPMVDPPVAAWKAGLGTWMIEAPVGLFSPVIRGWVAGVIHLRPIEGVPPAHRKFPDAEHELMVYAIDPKFEVEAIVDEYEHRTATGDGGSTWRAGFLAGRRADPRGPGLREPPRRGPAWSISSTARGAEGAAQLRARPGWTRTAEAGPRRRRGRSTTRPDRRPERSRAGPGSGGPGPAQPSEEE